MSLTEWLDATAFGAYWWLVGAMIGEVIRRLDALRYGASLWVR